MFSCERVQRFWVQRFRVLGSEVQRFRVQRFTQLLAVNFSPLKGGQFDQKRRY